MQILIIDTEVDELIDRRDRIKKDHRANRWSCDGIIWNCDVSFYVVLPDEHLRPVVAALNITHTDLLEATVEDVGTVTGRVHPAVDHALRTAVAHCDVFAGSTVSDAELLHHVEW